MNVYNVYIFVCNTYALHVVILFRGLAYGLASTEAGATPASLVVISHLPPSVRPSNNPGGIREADRICDTQGSAHAAVYIRLTREAV